MNKKETDSGVRYERKDIRLRWLLAIMAGVCCFAAVHYYATWRFFWWQENARQAEKSPYPLRPTISTRLPPEPRLEQLDRMAGVEGTDVFERLTAQERVLNSYGLTGETGFVHIPIQQAIKLTAGKLPVRQQPPAQAVKDRGLLDAGESNSGRVFRGERP